MICPFCNQPEVFELFEVWPEERAFMIETCCEGSHEAFVQYTDDMTTEEWRELFDRAGIGIRQIFSEDYWLQIDFGLAVGEVSQAEAKQFVRDHHRHNRPPAGWRWGHGCYNGDELIAVAMVGRPVARAIDHNTTVEVNRLCVNHGLNKALIWNACSMLYGAAAKEAKRRGFSKIITYTLQSEPGTALRGAGWNLEMTTKGGSWNRPSRPRKDMAPTIPKVRWSRELRIPRDSDQG